MPQQPSDDQPEDRSPGQPAAPNVTRSNHAKSISASGNADLRHELDKASKLRVPQDYRDELERLRKKYRHSISILRDGIDRITRFNCFAYGLGFWKHAEYIRRVDAAGNSAIADSHFVSWVLEQDILREISVSDAKEGDVVLYFDKGAVTHAAVLGEEQTLRSKWGGNEVHQHGLWEVPAQYGDTVRYYRKPDAASLLSHLQDIK